MSVNWSNFISSPQQLQSDPAAFFAAAVADDGVAVLDQDMALAATPDAFELPRGSSLTIRSPDGGPFRDIKLTGNVNGLRFMGTTVLSTSLAERSVTGAHSFRVAETSGVEVGDYCTCQGDLSQRRSGSFPNYKGDQVDMGFGGVVTALDAATGTVTIDNPILWPFEPDRALTYVAVAGQTRFLYRVVRIAASLIAVLVDGVLQVEGMLNDFVFSGVNGNDPELAPDAAGIWIDFNSAMAGGERVTFRVVSNAVVTFRRSGRLTVENLRLVSDDDAYGQKTVIRDNLRGSLYHNIEMVSLNQSFGPDGKPGFGGAQFIHVTGYDTVLDGYEMTGGGYGLFFSGGNFLEKNGVAWDQWESNQCWFFAHGLTVQNVERCNNRTAVGGHGGHDVTVSGIRLVDTDMHVRSLKVSVSDLIAYGHKSIDSLFSLGYGNAVIANEPELDSQNDNPSAIVMNPAFNADSRAENWMVRVPDERTLSFSIMPSHDVSMLDVDLGGLASGTVVMDGSAGLPTRVLSMSARNVQCRGFNCRLCLSVDIDGCRFEDLRLPTDAGRTGGVTVSNTILDATGRTEAGDWVVADANVSLPSGPRSFYQVTAIRPGASSLTSNGNASVQALYSITNTTLNGAKIGS